MAYLKHAKIPIKLIVSAVILVLLLMRMDMESLREITDHIHASAWFYALALILFQIAILTYRWQLFININGRKIDYINSLRITLVSLLANFLFITSIGGVVVRIALAMQHGISFFKSVFATILDRMMTLMALVVLAALFLPSLGKFLDPQMYQTICLLIFMCVFMTAVFLPLLFQGSYKDFMFSNRKLAVSFKYLRTLLTDHHLLGKIIGISIAAQISYFTAVHLISMSTGVEFSFLDLMAVLPVIAIVASLPIGFGGWGIRESAFVYGLGLIGVPMETAFLISVQIGLLSMVATAVAGIPALMNSDMRALLLHHKQGFNKRVKASGS